MKNARSKKTNADTADLPPSATDFPEAGIRPCCDEKRTSEADMAPLNKTKARGRNEEQDMDEEQFKALTSGEQADYILRRHHAFLWKTMPELRALLPRVLRGHGKQHEELKDIHELCSQLVSDMEEHLIDEETTLFSAVKKNSKSSKSRDFDVEHLMDEHSRTKKLFKKIRKAADDYTVPKDACGQYTFLYELLPKMEEDTLRHYHLEDAVLFKNIAGKDLEEKK